MSTTFNLTNTATDVNTAIQAVVGADSAPTNGSANMVTSDGVFDYVGTQLGGLAGKTVTAESTGIASTDNDTSIPTSAAVKDYVDSNAVQPTVVGCGSFIVDGNLNNGYYSASSTTYIPLELDNTFSTGQVGSVSGSTVTLPAGTYFVQPNFVLSSDTTGSWNLALRHNDITVLEVVASSGGAELSNLVGSVFVSSTNSQTIRIYATEVSGGSTLRLPNTAKLVISRLF